MNYVACAATSDLASGSLTPVEVGGKKLLLANADGMIYAMQRKCPHLGFDLCKGHIEGKTVVCRMHDAAFDLASGEPVAKAKILFLKMQPKCAVTYPVKVENGQVLVGV